MQRNGEFASFEIESSIKTRPRFVGNLEHLFQYLPLFQRKIQQNFRSLGQQVVGPRIEQPQWDD